MTKLRTPDSQEDALMRIYGHLGRKRAAHICGKSEALLHAWADPDNDTHHAPGWALEILNTICFQEVGEAPYKQYLDRSLEAVEHHHEIGCPLERMGNATREFGEAMDAFQAANKDDADIVKLHEALREIREARDELAQAERDIAELIKAQPSLLRAAE